MKPSQGVLVTGAGGFIGSRLVPRLREAGHPTTVSSARLDREALPDHQAGVVVHLAGLTYVPDSWQDPLRFYQTNVMGTLRVLQSCAQSKARMVYVSSYVYGPPDRLPISEEAPTRPANPYMLSKVLAEDGCTFYAERLGLEVLIIRPFNVYGPGQDRRFVIPALVDQLLDPAKRAVTVSDPRPRRDFLYVDDLVGLLVAAVAADAVGLVNAGSGTSHSIEEVFDLLREITGIDKPLVLRDEERRGEIMDVVADIDRARRLLDWGPTTSLRDGLRLTAEAMSQR